jgi:probable rRNA maturation factor
MTVRLVGPPRRVGLPEVDAAQLRSRARRVLRELGHTRSELSVVLVDDAEMRELNRVWRGKPRPTDVLAFSMLEGEGIEHRRRLLGDVVISVETARRQARARHRALDEEVTRLLIHGTLHLLGYDHERSADAREMRAVERRLFRVVRDDA